MGYTFGTQSTYAVGSDPSSVTTADVNGDGLLDLVTANQGSNTVSVLLGQAGGGFGTQTTYAVGSRPSSVTVADVNGDGLPDLVTANTSGNTVSVLLGQAGGGFAAQATYDVGSAPSSVTAADVNGDGRLDLVTANADRTVSVLLGQAGGGFSSRAAYPVGNAPSSVTAADVNGDGRLDLVTANSGDNTVSVRLGQAGGGFAASARYTVGSSPSSVTAADVNGDGCLDLVTANSGDNTVSVLLGQAAGGFAAPATYAVGSSPSSVTATDVNGDGRLDLVTANLGDGTVSVLLGQAGGGFSAQSTYAVGSQPDSVTAADVNGDGHLDLVIANRSSDTVSVLLGTPTVAVTAVTAPSPPSPGAAFKIGDTLAFTLATDVAVNSVTPGVGGTTPTLALGNGASASYTGFDAGGLHFSYTVQAGQSPAQDTGDLTVTGLSLNGASVNHDATVGFAAKATYAVGSYPYGLTAADMNGDGRLDLVTANRSSGTVSVLLGQGGGVFAPQVTYAVGNSPFSVMAANVNGDGRLDLVTANYIDDTVSVLLGQAGGGFVAQTTYAVGTGPATVTAADVNGDGRLDLVTANFIDNTVSVLLGQAGGGFSAQATYSVGRNPFSVTAADVNGDGRLDLVTANLNSNNVSVLLGQAGGGFATQATYAVGGSPQSVTAADVNGDGRLDLVTANSGSNTVSVLLGQAGGGFSGQATYAVGSGPFSVTAADVNGDGHLDLVTANYISGTVSVLLGQTGGGFAAQTSYAVGRGPFSVTAADVDGDGRLDIVTANALDGTVSVLRNMSTPGAVFDASSFSLASGRDTGLAVDATRPTATSIAPSTTGPTNATSLTETVSFSEAVTGVGAGDFTVHDANGNVVAGATVGTPVSSDGGKSYSVSVSGLAGDGSVRLDLNASGTGIRDTAGNPVAGGLTGTVTTLDHTRPTVTSIVPSTTSPTNATTLTETVVFSEAVTGVDALDFSVSATSGTASAHVASVTPVGSDGTTYSVVLDQVSGTGSLRLDLDGPAATGIRDVAGNLIAAGYTGGTATSVSHPISVTSVSAASPEAPGAALKIGDTLVFTLATDVAVSSVTPGAGGATPTLALGNGASASYTGFDAAGLHFSYTVQAGQSPTQDTGDLTVTGLSLNGASVNHDATVSFAAQATYAVGYSPSSVTAADVNGDGRLDLVTANGSNTVSVLLGQAGGGFAAPATYAVGTGPNSVTAADVNGDGRLDLVTANFNSSNVSVLLGQAGGGFAAQATYAVGSYPQSVTTADVNGDGRLDLVIANLLDNTVSVLLGQAGGGFATKATYAVGTSPSSVTAADVNGDGRLDLVTANRFDNTVSVLLGQAGGGFAGQATYAVGNDPASVTAADVNGDGRLDLVTANYNSNTVSVLLGQAGGGFSAPATYAVGDLPFSVTAVDVNGDGHLDLVTANTNTISLDNSRNTVSVLLGQAGGGFAAQATYSVGSFPRSVTAADVDSDGRLDLVTTNNNDDTVSVLRNVSTPGAVLDASSFTLASGRDTGLAVDATPPTVTSIVASTTSPTNATTLTETVVFSEAVTGVDALDFSVSATSGMASAHVASVTPVGSDGTTYSVVLDQVSGTGSLRLDLDGPAATGIRDVAGNLIAAGYTGGTATSVSHPISITSVSAVSPEAPGAALKIGDTLVFTLATDVAVNSVTPSAGGATPTLALGNGASASYTGFDAAGLHFSYTVQAGQSPAQDTGDLTVTGLSLNGASVNHDATVGFAAQATYAVGSYPYSVTAADVNGDGRLDLVTSNGSATVSVLLGQAGGGFAGQATYAVGNSPLSVTAADVNGDGRLDLVTTNFGNGTVSVLLGQAGGGFAPEVTYAVGANPQSVTAADVNGDGRLDLVIANSAMRSGSSTVSVLLGQAGGSFAPQVTYGVDSGPHSVTAADVNGDGKLDLVTASYDRNTVSVLLGQAGGGFAPQVTYAVDSGPQSVTAADVDGDGRLDLVTANGSSDTVSVLLGQGGGVFATQVTYAVGGSPNSVTAADVNGDGRLDLVTANRSSGTVSVLLGQGGGVFAPQVTYAAGDSPSSVTAADVDGDGRLDLVVANSISISSGTVSVLRNVSTPGAVLDASSFTLASGRDTGLAVDATRPTATSIAPSTTGPTNATTLTETVSFSEAVTGVGATDFTVHDANGNAVAGVTVSTPVSSDGGKSYSVSVSGLTGDGSVHLDLNASGTGIRDTAGNPVAGGLTGTVTTLDHTRPTVTSIVASTTSPTNATTLTETVVFSEAVSGVDALDFSVSATSGTASAHVASVTPVGSDGTTYSVVLDQVSGTGSLRLDLDGSAATGIRDVAGNLIAAGYTGGTATSVSHPISVTSVSAASPEAPGAALKIGDTLSFTLATDVAVSSVTPGVGGATPTLTLGNGASASYTGFDAAGLHFSYTVQAGQSPAQDTSDLTVTGLSLNGASVNHDATVSFAAQATYAVGYSPSSVTAADVNGDGRLDLVTANLDNNTVSVLLGQAGGGFAGQATYAVGSNPSFVTAADVNGDGRLDLVTANYNTNTVSVLLGQAGGGFAGQVTYAVGSNPSSVTAADVNGDGRLDLVTANYGSNTVSVLLGQAAGGFATQATYAVGTSPNSVTAADVNGDGRLDLVTANYFGNTVSVLLGQAGGGFAGQVTYAVGSNPSSVTAADVDGDGRLDLVTANYGSGTVSVLLGQAGGGFSAQSTYAVGSHPGSVTAADVNGDGRLDLVTANSFSTTVSVLLGQGGGVFAPQVTYAVGDSPISVTAADVDGDGRLDLVVANYNSGTVSVLRNVSTPGASLDASSFALPPGHDTGLVVDATRPTATSTAATAAANAASETYAVHFSEAVSGVDKTDFALTASGSAAGSVTTVTGSGQDYTVTATGITGTGSLSLALAASPTVTDTAGNALTAAGLTGSTAHAVDRDAPSVTSITPATTGPTNATTLTETVTFSEAVTGLDKTDFTLSGTGSAGATVDSVATTGTPGVYTVTLTGVSGTGFLQLALLDDGTVKDTAGNGLAAGLTGTATRLDHTAPTATSTAAVVAANAASETYAVHFSEAVSGVDKTDFALTASGSAAGSVTTVTGSGQDYTVTATGITGTGSLSLALAANPTITDTAGNALTAAGLTGSTAHAVDRDAPSVTSITPATTGPTNATTLTETVVFSEAVTGVDASDFIATATSGTASAHIASVMPVGSDGTTYSVVLDRLAGDGTIRLDLKASGTGITDAAANPVAAGYTGGTATSLDHTAPSLTLALSAGTGTDPIHGHRPLITDAGAKAQVLNAAAFADAFQLGGTASDATFTATSDAVVSFTAADGHTVPAHSAVLTGDGGGGFVYAFRVDAPGTAHGDNADLAAALTDGTYTVQATVQDAAGNLTRTAPQTLIVDTTADAGAPATLVVADTADHVINAREAGAVAFTVAGLDADAAAVATFSDGTRSRTVQVAGDGGYSVDLSGFNGSVTSSLAITDIHQNTAGVTGSVVRADTTTPLAPSAPTDATVVNGYVNSTYDTTAQVLTGTAEPGSTVSLFDGTTRIGTTIADAGTGAWRYTIGTLPDAGTHSYTATATDAAGNTGPAGPALVFTIDTTVPAAPSLALAHDTGSSATDHVTRDPAIVSISSAAGDTLQYRVDGGAASTTEPHFATDGTADGTHTVSVTETDTAGNVSAATTLSFVLDTHAPGAPAVALVNDTGNSATDHLTSDARISVTTAEAGGSLSYVVDGGGAATQYDPSRLAPGAHTVAVTQTDTAGNVSTAGSLAFILGGDAPIVRPDTASGTGVTATLSGNVLANDTDASGLHVMSVRFSDSLTHVLPSSGTVSVDGTNGTLTIAADGSYSYHPTAIGPAVFVETIADALGNTSQTTLTLEVARAAIPAALSFGFALTDARFDFSHGRDLMTAPDGTVTDLTGVASIRFTDGTVQEQDGAPLVDDLYYDATNLDVWRAHIDPDQHYAAFGWREGRDPDAFFSTRGYLAANPDVAAAGIDPLTHYDSFGWHEGRSPGASFSAEAYLAANPDVARAGLDPLAHYLAYGQGEGRASFPGLTIAQGSGDHLYGDFDASFYLAHNPDVAAAARAQTGSVDAFAFQHYLTYGAHEGRDPDALFSTTGYLSANPDVAAAGVNPLLHYEQYGWHEGRDPSAGFHTNAYLLANPDVAAARIDPLQHYLQYGSAEARHLA